MRTPCIILNRHAPSSYRNDRVYAEPDDVVGISTSGGATVVDLRGGHTYRVEESPAQVLRKIQKTQDVRNEMETMVRLSHDMLEDIQSQTEWDRLEGMTDEDVESAIEEDPDAALVDKGDLTSPEDAEKAAAAHPSEKPLAVIYTDGAAHPNPGQGGWGAVIVRDEREEEISGYPEGETTNNRMEITAIKEALGHLQRPHQIELFSDSEYAIKVLSGAWEANANSILIEKTREEMERHDVTFSHVSAHSGHEYNERADDLANQAVKA